MNDILFTPIRLSELEALIQSSVEKALQNQSNKVEQSTPTDKLLTIEEACILLHLKKATVYTKVSKGELPVCKPEGSKRLMFSKLELLEYLKNGRKKTNSEIDKAANSYLTKKR